MKNVKCVDKRKRGKVKRDTRELEGRKGDLQIFALQAAPSSFMLWFSE